MDIRGLMEDITFFTVGNIDVIRDVIHDVRMRIEEEAERRTRAQQAKSRTNSKQKLQKMYTDIKNTSNHQDGVFTDYRYILSRTHIPIVRRRCICLYKRACYTRSDGGRKRHDRVQR